MIYYTNHPLKKKKEERPNYIYTDKKKKNSKDSNSNP